MSDGIDLAQHYDELYRVSALSAQLDRARVHREAPPALCCTGCGEEIDAERRRVAPNAIRCIGCQTKHERINGRCA